MYTSKKVLSFVAIFLILKDILFIGEVFWVGTLDVNNFAINGSTTNLALNPWDGFYVSLEGFNNVGENIKNVFFHLNLWNSYLSYNGTNHKTQVNTNDTINPLPITAFSGTEILSEITNVSFPTVGTTFATKKARFINISTATGFQISSNIPTYQNTLTAWFNAKKTSDSTDLISASVPRIIYVNVKPHITSYSFSKSSLVGNGTDSVDLTVRVKDYNGCTNIDGGTVTANLTALGLTSSESIGYDSCDADGKTAIFKKNSITTLATVWDKTFAYTDFTATDRDGNSTDPNDANTTFDDEDLKTSIILTVATPIAPVVTIASTTPTVIGSAGSSTVAFSADKEGTYKVVINGNGSCSAGTILTDWTTYTTGSTINSIVSGASLSEWANAVYTCVKTSAGDIGSANTTVTKDTVVPVISSVTISPSSVVANDSSTSFQCNEAGSYRVTLNALDSGYLATTANTTNTVTLPNAYISVGTNTVTLYCKDTAGNITNTTSTVSKVAAPPAMTASGMTLIDNDTAWDGVDGRDLKVTWDSTVGTSYTGFESYRIYILPIGTAFTGTYVWLVANSGATTWTGSSYTSNDSLWNPLSWGDYVTYVAIMGTSGNLWTSASATGTLVSDVVSHPSVLSASFTSTGNLSVKFNTNLNTSTGSHSATGFIYQIGATTYTGTSVSSLSNDTINIAIADVWATSNTGVLSLSSGAVLGTDWAGSINYATGGIVIADAIAPTVAFSTGTTAYYTNFYSGSLIFSHTASEDLLWAGGTKIVFTRSGGNVDTTKTFSVTNSTNLLSGTSTETIDLVSLGLVSWAYYDVTFVAKDLLWNTTTSAPVSIKFDNAGPSIVSISAFWPQTVLGIANPTFSWLTTTDNSGNGSGVKGYKLRVYTGSATYTSWHTCTGAYTETVIANPAQLSSQITLANLYNYAWAVSAYDNMENIGTLSSCDTFYTNTSVPSFSVTSITDTVLGSTTYTKGWNNLVIKSTITNTDSWHVWLNATSLKDSTYANISCATPVSWVTCTYTSSIATYTFETGALSSLSSGVKQAQFTATNISWVNTGTTLASITLDNTAPTIGANTLLSPISGTFWGTGVTISWTQGNITDNIGLAYVKLDYFDGTTWALVGTGVNSGSYPWNITALTSGANFQVRISAYDGVGLSSTFTGGVFALDKVTPTVSTSALTYPSALGIKLKWGSSVNITWDSGNIVDTGGLATNPITLSYSLDGGINYTQIATNLANNGSYAWTVPSALNNATMKIKLEVTDIVGNKATDVSDNNFEVDSTLPTITVNYAGNGGSTPPSNSYINNSWFDVSATINDTNLSGGVISYSLYNQTNNTYFNGTIYSGSTEVWNTLATSTGSTYNLATTIVSSVINGDYYKLKLKADDIVGNSLSTSQVTFIGDTTNPTITTTTASGTYFSGTISVIGTASDTGSTLSSVNLEIKKWAQWWNGSSWVGSRQLLVATTANSYTNWSYDFNPVADGDGQNYIVTAIVNDRAYKTNNSSSGTITLIKDTLGPTIASGVFTHTISGIQKDGNVINITWNTGTITSTGASVNQNSIVLKFNNGAGITTITGATANDGSYSYTLPTGNTQNAFFTIEAYDALGNVSNLVTSSSFSLDSIPPTISSIDTVEDTLGKINGVNIYFNELISHSSIHLSDFSIAGVTGISTGTISDVGTGTIFAINFTSTGTTATTPSITYTAWALTDLALKPLVSTTQTSLDKATPRFISSKIYDTNGNGKVDQIIVSASEPLVSNTDISSWTINSPLLGLSLSSASVVGSTVVLTLTEPTNANTAVGGMTVSFLNNGSWKDSANNLAPAIANLAISDTAAPVITTMETSDNNGVYAINLTFSEDIIGTLSGLTLSGSSTFTGAILQPTTNTLRLVTTDSTATDTAKNYSLSYNGSGTYLKDASNNFLANFTNTNVTDGIAPKILTRATIDNNGNGKIDQVRIGFSEPVTGSSAGTIVSVGGYLVTGYIISGTGVIAILTESATIDTSTTPSVQFQNTTVTDIAGNTIASEASGTNAYDGVGPIITNIRFDGVNTLYATFSETISGAILPGSFILSGATATINSVNIPTGSNSGTLTLNNNGIIYGVSELSFTSNSVGDLLGNKQTGAVFSKISASIIINEVMWSGTGWSATQYIELRNLGSTPVDISGWTIDNAATAGTTLLTLPATQTIAANGLYLITATDPSNASNLISTGVTAQFTGSLSLAQGQTGNLILKNGGIVYDQAKVNSWPAGDVNLPASMERKSSAGDGLSSINWYLAQTGTGFKITGPLGTPGTANAFDAIPPTITSFSPTNDVLSPVGNITLQYNYSDSGGMAAVPNYTFLLEKNNGAGGFSDVTSTSLSSSWINASTASFTTTLLSYGQYRATFTISDAVGNNVQQISSFYVDALSLTVSTGSYSIGTLSPNTIVTWTGEMTITLQTLGAWFNLSLGGSGTLDAGLSQIAAWNGTSGYGIDYASSGSGTLKAYNGTLTALSGATLENFATGSYIGGNWKLHTFTYTIKYGAKITSVQAANLYSTSNTLVHLILTY